MGTNRSVPKNTNTKIRATENYIHLLIHGVNGLMNGQAVNGLAHPINCGKYINYKIKPFIHRLTQSINRKCIKHANRFPDMQQHASGIVFGTQGTLRDDSSEIGTKLRGTLLPL